MAWASPLDMRAPAIWGPAKPTVSLPLPQNSRSSCAGGGLCGQPGEISHERMGGVALATKWSIWRSISRNREPEETKTKTQPPISADRCAIFSTLPRK